jgi:hypothetical protein
MQQGCACVLCCLVICSAPSATHFDADESYCTCIDLICLSVFCEECELVRRKKPVSEIFLMDGSPSTTPAHPTTPLTHHPCYATAHGVLPLPGHGLAAASTVLNSIQQQRGYIAIDSLHYTHRCAAQRSHQYGSRHRLDRASEKPAMDPDAILAQKPPSAT